MGSLLEAQHLQPHFRQFTTENGLPSSEVYFVFQDQDCFLWFGTDNGIARYDGYEFKVFDSDDGLEDVVIFSMRESPTGEKWVSTYSGRIYRFAAGRFHPFRHNDRLRQLKNDHLILTLLDVKAEGELIIHIVNRGILRIGQTGGYEWLTEDRPAVYNYTYRSQRRSCDSQNTIFRSYAPNPGRHQLREVLEYDPRHNQWESLGHYQQHTDGVNLVFTDSADIAGQRAVILVSSDSLHLLARADRPQQALAPIQDVTFAFPHAERGWLLGCDNGGGLQYLLWNQAGEIVRRDTLLSSHSISFGYYDHQGGLWVASLDAGIFYAPRPDILTYTAAQGFSASKALSIALVGDTAFYAGFADGAIQYFRFGRETARDVLPQRPSIKNFSLFYDSIHQQLYTNLYRVDVSQSPVATEKIGDPAQVVPHKLTPLLSLSGYQNDSVDWLLYAQGSAFGVYDLRQQRVQDFCSASRSFRQVLSIHDYHIDTQGRHWVGTLSGLYRLTAGQQLVFDTLGHPALGERVQCIASLPPQSVLFGTRGRGLIYYTPDSIRQIDERHQLASNMIRGLHRDDRGSVWVATLTGLSRINFTPDGQVADIRTFRNAHGLPSEEIHGMDSRNNQIWLATSNGIVEFIEPPRQPNTTVPSLRRVTVNGQELAREALLNLPAYRNDIRIEFSTINFLMAGGIPYRYRLQADAKWQETRQPFVYFANLSPGEYRFEVQSQNQDLYWSESLEFPLIIAPPWYQRWYVYVFGPLILGLAIWWYFRDRDRVRQQEQHFKEQLQNMERAALHAQMNPHFIFNCLNSIQQFVVNHDEKKAITYLAQFAQLIRNTLKVSVQGEHTLAQEISMLNNYLALEKLRFKEDFTYHLEVAKHLVPEQILLPSLLIQPFVENAIQHGLENGDRAGEVRVFFGGTEEMLEVRISDNGAGFDPQLSADPEAMGMDITRRRLEILNQQFSPTSKPMEVRKLYDARGVACGSEIIIHISTTPVPSSIH